jgi:four helix bundle protein
MMVGQRGKRRNCAMGEYRKLMVWEKAHALAVEINGIAMRIRGGTHAPLRNQMVRAALSIPANIVEGRAQNGEKDFARFIGYAMGSAAELEYHLVIAHDIHVVNEIDFNRTSAQLTEIRRMLYALSKRLRLSAQQLS